MKISELKIYRLNEYPDVLKFFENKVACGVPTNVGDPTGEDFNLLTHYGMEPSTTIIVEAQGDSMEPDYHDGDLVLVERIPDAPSLESGEIGAFIVGNETYIKRYEEDGLHSLNSKYKPMHFADETSVYLIGRVLGVLAPEAIATDEDVEGFLKTKTI